jgi:WD40 repeat protein
MLSGHADAVWKAAFAPDGQSIVSVSTDGTIRVWDLPEPIKASHPAP